MSPPEEEGASSGQAPAEAGRHPLLGVVAIAKPLAHLVRPEGRDALVGVAGAGLSLLVECTMAE